MRLDLSNINADVTLFDEVRWWSCHAMGCRPRRTRLRMLLGTDSIRTFNNATDPIQAGPGAGTTCVLVI